MSKNRILLGKHGHQFFWECPIKTSLVFDLTKIERIAMAFQLAKKNTQFTVQLVFNEIDKLINLLLDNENSK
jgi:hypothetical protein